MPLSLLHSLAHAVLLRLDDFTHAWELSAAVEGLHALGVPPQAPMIVALRRMGRSDIRPKWQEHDEDDEFEEHGGDEDGGQQQQQEELVLNRLITACAPNAGALLALATEHLTALSPVNAATLVNRCVSVCPLRL